MPCRYMNYEDTKITIKKFSFFIQKHLVFIIFIIAFIERKITIYVLLLITKIW